MTSRQSTSLSIIVLALSIGLALVGANALIGHPARWVHVITLFFGGVAVGVSLARTVALAKASRRGV